MSRKREGFFFRGADEEGENSTSLVLKSSEKNVDRVNFENCFFPCGSRTSEAEFSALADEKRRFVSFRLFAVFIRSEGNLGIVIRLVCAQALVEEGRGLSQKTCYEVSKYRQMRVFLIVLPVFSGRSSPSKSRNTGKKEYFR